MTRSRGQFISRKEPALQIRPLGLSSPPAAADPFANISLDGRSPLEPRQAPSFGNRWRVRTQSGIDMEVSFDDLKEMVRSGTVGPDDEAGTVDGPLRPVRSHVEFGARPVEAARPAEVTASSSKPRVSGARAAGGGLSLSPRVLALVGVLVVVGGGFALFTLMPELFEKRTEAGVNPLRRVRSAWSTQFPDVSGTARDHVDEGKKLMAQDTAQGVRKADDELRQALLLDIGSVPAIAAWVENLASLPSVRADAEAANLADEAIQYALKREPNNVDALRAHAALKLALGDVDGALRIGTLARTHDAKNVATALLVARANVERSPDEALSIIQSSVRSAQPENPQAYVVEGAARRRLGDFKQARDLLAARLTADPQNPAALKELARLELELGNPKEALAALDKLVAAEDKDVEAHLMRAKVAYQTNLTPEGLAAANTFLDEVFAKHESSAGDLLLAVLAHAAFVKGELGDLDKAIALGERARATDPSYAPALYVLGRLYRIKGDLPSSQKTLEAAVRAAQQRDPFYEPLVRAEWATAQAQAGDLPSALRNYQQVVEFDPRFFRGHFGMAAAHMKQDKATPAMTLMRKARDNDPEYERNHRALTDYPTQPKDLSAFADVFKAAKAKADDESLMALQLSAEGMIRFHAGERTEARALFERSLREDPYDHGSLLYLGAMDLDDGRVAEAKRRFKLAVNTTAASHAITRIYLARAEMKTGEVDVAQKRLEEVIDQNPSLWQAHHWLGVLHIQQKRDAQGATELKKVVRADPDFLPSKQALAALP